MTQTDNNSNEFLCTCDTCESVIRVTPESLKTEMLTKEVERVSFSCGECGAVYTISITNDEARKLISDRVNIKTILSNLIAQDTDIHDKQISELRDRDADLCIQITTICSELKAEFL